MPRLRRQFLRTAAATLGMALMLAGLPACERISAPKFNAVDVTGASFGQALSLPDPQGKLRSLADFKGKVVVVFFGYTQCPDVCPGTLAELAQVKKTLGAHGDQLQGVFVSVDPERDTPAVLTAYMSSFDPSFVALRGTPEQTAAVAQEFKVLYSKVPGKSAGSYTIDHTAASFVFDRSGKLRLYTRYGSGPEALAADIKLLLAER